MIDPPEQNPPGGGITLAVLAGGAGARMGLPKGLLQLHGRPILFRLLDRLRWPGLTLLVLSPGREVPAGAEAFHHVVWDQVADEGPVRGVLTALQASQTPITIVAPVDMPMLLPEPLIWLARQLETRPGVLALMVTRRADASESQRIEPMPIALRTTEALPLLREHVLSKRRSLQSLLDHPQVAAAPAPNEWPEDFWINLNHPADLSNFLNRQQPNDPL